MNKQQVLEEIYEIQQEGVLIQDIIEALIELTDDYKAFCDSENDLNKAINCLKMAQDYITKADNEGV